MFSDFLSIPPCYMLCKDTRKLLDPREFSFALLEWAQKHYLGIPAKPVVSNDVRVIYSQHPFNEINDLVQKQLGFLPDLKWTITGVYPTYAFIGASFFIGKFKINVYFHTEKRSLSFFIVNDGRKERVKPAQLTELFLRNQAAAV